MEIKFLLADRSKEIKFLDQWLSGKWEEECLFTVEKLQIIEPKEKLIWIINLKEEKY